MMIRISCLFRTVLTGVFAIALLVASTTMVSANALLEFSDTLRSFSATFKQTVYDADSVVLQESTGVVVLARPGRFKWTYEEPISQVIVADGLTLWVYDEEIKQVTKQPQSTTLGSAPIGLLSGQRDIESEFIVTELGSKDGLEWFQLEPLVSDTDFNEIFLALDGDGLHAMELRDNFDQATQIVFSGFAKNIAVDREQFNFVVPEGVDVVGEGGVPESQDDLLNDDSPESTDTPDNPVVLPADDTDPLLDDISTSEVQNNPRNPQSTGTEDSITTGNTAATGGAISDENLLGDDLADPVESSTEPETELEPLIDTADPAREITFEEQKVTE